MFMEFADCRDWYLGSFPPGEVKRQRARTHDGLYFAYIVGEANTRAANHQIVREWCTMVRERTDWEKYHERLLKQVQDFEKMKSAFAEENAAFETEKKYEEWDREGLKSKLHAAEELLSKERAKWKEAELNAQVANKDKNLAAKDVEIAEFKHRLFEAHDKNESLEIDLETERVKAATAEEAKQRADEARDISTSTLNVALNNYAEAQSIVDTLVSETEWMRTRGVAAIANSILNATEMDEVVAALIDASHAVGHRGGYPECAHHVEEAFGQEFDTRHCLTGACD
ncbi:hypothetical protein Hdeb2414_s0004g00129321 [Helianthus debilis subsp. tardiflorus]